MTSDPAHLYAAFKAHDARFDGRVFVGVSSTGIYCRPVCVAKFPKRENCSFHRSAAAAEAAGFRPCLRCRPELAPGYASVDASMRLAHAASSLIDDGCANDASLKSLAQRLAVTDRHLRRVFREAFGVSPVAYAQTQRLLLAKRLLTDTAMPVLDVALASGFGSLRRFNAALKERYRLTPSDFRRKAGAAAPLFSPAEFVFELGYRPPLDWPALLGFLGARTIDGVEEADGDCYRRTLTIRHGEERHAGWFEAEPVAGKDRLRVRIAGSLGKVLPAVLARVKRLFDLACDPAEIAATLGPLARRPGLRLPGVVDGFEIAVRAVLGQQITVRAARTLAQRFAIAFGTPMATPFAGLVTLFPTAVNIAGRSIDEIATLGIIGARARTIQALARAIAAGKIRLEPGVDVDATIVALVALPGIGDWTAQYIAMRALAWPDAFPAADYGVMKALGERNLRRVRETAEQWRPWRAYAVMHLWDSLMTAGTAIDTNAATSSPAAKAAA